MSPSLPLVARYTWARQWPAALLEGVAFGIIGLASFAVKRSLGAPEEMVPLLIAFWQVVWIFSPAVGPLLARSDPQRLWRIIAVAAHLPILLVAFVAVTPAGEAGRGTGGLGLFLVLMIAYYAMATAYVPHRGALFRTNYAQHVRGRMFGLFLVVSLLGTATAAKAAGFLLDSDPRWLRVLFPIAAICGAAAFFRYGRIKWRRARQLRRGYDLAERPWRTMVKAWGESWRILREDRPFRTYEIGFMLYGAGFLCSVGLLVLYAEAELGLSYDQWTSAQFLAAPAAQIVGAAFFGRLADRIGILRSTAVAFALLGLFFALMPLVGSAGGLAAAYALWGLAMAGVMVGWSLGPLHFAPEDKAHMYTAVHFCLVGVRSIVAPFLGFAVKQVFSYPAAFGLSAVLVALGAATIWRLARSTQPLS